MEYDDRISRGCVLRIAVGTVNRIFLVEGGAPVVDEGGVGRGRGGGWG